MFLNFSDRFNMTESATNIEDLEDGEIESEGEEIQDVQTTDKPEDDAKHPEITVQEKPDNEDFNFTKPGKKKKSKSKKGEQKQKDKNKSSRKYSNPTEDDFVGSIEKAIRKAMNKNDNGKNEMEEDVDDRRKHKKRKKQDGKEGPNKKKKKQEYSDEMDESEMMCVRGASPVHKNSPGDMYDDDRDSYSSDDSEGSRGQHHHRSQRHRQMQRERNNKNNKNDRRRSNAHPMQDPDGVCLYFMQGKCHKGDDCIYSHDAQPPRKMELCKFYLMDCCAKRDKCLYMHADFPCKYYHTGLPCIYKDECKFAHGKPLTENLKNILLKHIESAPKEILGDFPRLNREGALKMIQFTQAKLIQQFSESSEPQDKSIPSLFELNIPNPQNSSDQINTNNFNLLNNDRQNKVSPKVRQSRWQNDSSNSNQNVSLSPTGNSNVLSIKNLNGVLTPRQISNLSKMGIENLDQLGQLTVLQLNSIGLSLKQITEIQLNTMSIQKLGLINTNTEQNSQQFVDSGGAKDLDLRVPPVVAVANNIPVSSDLPGKDVDMRFQPVSTITTEEDKTIPKEPHTNKDVIDIDQYTKDALKFALKDKENIDISNEGFENDKPVISNETKDIDHRILPFVEDVSKSVDPVENVTIKKECDTDIRFLQPEPIYKHPEKRHRRSTTDDEDNNLLIDEKWYSSDEEKGLKSIRKSPASSPYRTSLSPPAPAPHVIEPSAVLSRLGDLSKIDISEEVTKLLNTMKNNLNETKPESTTISEITDSPKSRDPRSRRLSAEKPIDTQKTSSHKRTPRISIYECVDGEPTDGRRRTDVDLRKTEFAMPAFGDTDLRQSTSGDIDFRLGIPFKAIPNYTPASEIDGSINSHPPIPYKLVLIHIPRPDYTDIRNSTAKSQALVDPRLRKVFRLSIDESNSDSEKSSKPSTTGPRIDPRRKPKDSAEITTPDILKQNLLDMQTVLQNSDWYKELSSTQKIFVNQHLAPLTQMIKQFHQEKIPGKKFDITSVQSNTILCSILANLGISLNENGEFSYLPKPKEALLKTPVNFNQTNSPYSMNSGMAMPAGSMDTSNMNMMNMPMGIGGINMHGFNQHLPDPRSAGPAPGLLGIAPNIPHGFNANFGPPNNFGNMPFNGPGPGDFNFMDGDQNFPRFPNRGGHRGRGNDRWNRGNSGRGNRDRKGFNDRSNWKNN